MSVWIRVVVASVLCACATSPPAPRPAPAPVDPDAPLVPLDPGLRTGTLANGLTYFVHDEPTDRHVCDAATTPCNAVALVVKAGSLAETDRQRGAAHILLHLMAADEALDDVRAPDGKVALDHGYVILPLDRRASSAAAELDRKLARLRRFAERLEIDPARVAAAREAIAQEGFEEHGETELPPAAWDGTGREAHRPYAEPAADLTFREVADYYRRWYRARQLAVIVVGGGDAAAVATLVATHFATLPDAPAPARIDAPSPRRDAVSIRRTEDHARVEIGHRLPHRRTRGERGLRAALLDEGVNAILLERLGHAQFRHRPASLRASIDPLDAATDLQRVTFEANGLADLELVLRELERLRAHGITADELSILGRNRRPPIALRRVDALASSFARDTPYPGDALDAVAARLLGTVTVDEVNAAIRATLDDRTRTIAIDWPVEDAAVPSEAAIRELARTIAAAPPEPWTARRAVRPLMTPPSPGAIVTTATSRDITWWTLGNGARVVVCPVSPGTRRDHGLWTASSRIRLLAVGPGGWASLAPEAALHARFAGDIVRAGSVEGYPLRDLTHERNLEVRAFILPTTHRIEIEAEPWANLDDAFQALHLVLTRPQVTAEAFAAWRAERTAMLRPDPRSVAIEQLRALEGYPPIPPATAAMYDALDRDRALAAFRDQFGRLDSTTFVLVGDIDVARARPLVEHYLASLPGSATPPVPTTRVPVPPPKLPKVQTVQTGQVGSTVVYEYLAEAVKPDQPSRLIAERDLAIFGSAVEHTLADALKQRANVLSRISDAGRRYLRITFTNARSWPVTLDADLAGALDRMRTTGVEPAVLARVRADLPSGSAGDWTDAIVAAIGRREDLLVRSSDILDRKAASARVTTELIRATAKRFGAPTTILRLVR